MSSEQSTFLTLPIEIRLQIYRLLLPYTIETNSLRSTPRPSNSDTDHTPSSAPPLHRTNSMTSLLKTIKQPPVHCTLWRRGSTSILAVCRQSHSEAAGVLYGENVFSLMVGYERVAFQYAWQLPSGLQPQGRVDAALWLGEGGCLRRMRSLVVTLEIVDGYTATMKYNCGSEAMNAGLRGRVAGLVGVIRRRPGELPLRSVEIRSVGGARRVKAGEGFRDVVLPASIVEPLKKLRGVQYAKVTDDFGPSVARRLEQTMMGDEPVDDDEDESVSGMRYRMSQLKTSRWKNLHEPISPAGYCPLASARLQGFNEV